MLKNKNKTALVAGCGHPIADALADELQEAGLTVIRAGTSKKSKDGPEILNLDVTSEQSWRRVQRSVIKAHGSFEALVNVAMPLSVGNIESITLKSWNHELDQNLWGSFLGCQIALETMRSQQAGGAIINVGSMRGIIGEAEHVADCTAMGGLQLMTKSVAAHCAESALRITCNTIHMLIDSKQMIQSESGMNVDINRRSLRGNYICSDPEPYIRSASGLINHLISDNARAINGTEFSVDSGWSAS